MRYLLIATSCPTDAYIQLILALQGPSPTGYVRLVDLDDRPRYRTWTLGASFPKANSHITTLHQASGNSSTLQKKKMSQLAALIDNSPHYPAQLTLKRQVVTKVDLHQVFRALRTAFGVIHDGLLSDCKTDHGRILWPISESRRDPKLLEQDLLENVFGCSGSHCDRSATALDPRPGN